jgi:protein TonB
MKSQLLIAFLFIGRFSLFAQEKEPADILTFVDEVAVFPGGTNEMMLFLSRNIKYPQRALEEGIQGRVVIRFIVDKKGYIQNVKIVKGVPNCQECDDEALRVVKMMPKWKPAKNDGKIVNSYFNLPITYKLTDPEPVEGPK